MTFTAVDPRTGQPSGGAFVESTRGDVDHACRLAGSCPPLSNPHRYLRRIAEELEAREDALVATADRETALGHEGLRGELARTTGQLRTLADHVEAGAHLDAVHDHAEGMRPDLFRYEVPVGPVAVFGASNFPFAFGVAGTDTASALAAGCSVVAKGHPSHPSTSQLCADAIAAALPVGYFSLLQGTSNELGRWLVEHPDIRAAAFTGSFSGGRALHDLAALRDEPIPVYAEMGSVNPVFITRAAVMERGRSLAEGLVASVSLRSGQLCTKPGVVYSDAPELPALVAEAAAGADVGPLLNRRLLDAFVERLAATLDNPGVSVLHTGRRREGLHHPLTLLHTDAKTVRADPALAQEHFGPSCLIVVCDGFEDLPLSGSLTGTIHSAEGEQVDHLVAQLLPRVGRLVFDQFPTGVAVVNAMHHGGPYPASTYPAYSSVGPSAMRRFLRPVTLQNAPRHTQLPG